MSSDSSEVDKSAMAVGDDDEPAAVDTDHTDATTPSPSSMRSPCVSLPLPLEESRKRKASPLMKLAKKTYKNTPALWKSHEPPHCHLNTLSHEVSEEDSEDIEKEAKEEASTVVDTQLKLLPQLLSSASSDVKDDSEEPGLVLQKGEGEPNVVLVKDCSNEEDKGKEALGGSANDMCIAETAYSSEVVAHLLDGEDVQIDAIDADRSTNEERKDLEKEEKPTPNTNLELHESVGVEEGEITDEDMPRSSGHAACEGIAEEAHECEKTTEKKTNKDVRPDEEGEVTDSDSDDCLSPSTPLLSRSHSSSAVLRPTPPPSASLPSVMRVEVTNYQEAARDGAGEETNYPLPYPNPMDTPPTSPSRGILLSTKSTSGHTIISTLDPTVPPPAPLPFNPYVPPFPFPIGRDGGEERGRRPPHDQRSLSLHHSRSYHTAPPTRSYRDNRPFNRMYYPENNRNNFSRQPVDYSNRPRQYHQGPPPANIHNRARSYGYTDSGDEDLRNHNTQPASPTLTHRTFPSRPRDAPEPQHPGDPSHAVHRDRWLPELDCSFSRGIPAPGGSSYSLKIPPKGRFSFGGSGSKK